LLKTKKLRDTRTHLTFLDFISKGRILEKKAIVIATASKSKKLCALIFCVDNSYISVATGTLTIKRAGSPRLQTWGGTLRRL
jgi:hypothetical protein